MGVALGQMEGEKDVANFALESGSGNQIPDPVNYSPPNAIPSASSRPTIQIAEFTRPMPLALKEGRGVHEKGATASRRNYPYVGESVVGASSQPITVSSKAQPIPYTNDIQLTTSMTNQNGGLDPLTTPLEQLQNATSTSQNATRPPRPPKSTQRAGVKVTQALADWPPAFQEHMSPSQRNRTAGRHALSPNQISTGGDGGGARLRAATPQHYDTSNLVWKSPYRPLLQAVGDVSDSDEAEESGGYYSAVDQPEMHMPVMLPQTSGQHNLFLKRHEHNSLNSNVNPINFVIKKMMKTRRIAHRTSDSTSGSSMKVDTDSFMSRFS
jgi:hypothetical protein